MLDGAVSSSAGLYPRLLYAVACSEDAPLIDAGEAAGIQAGNRVISGVAAGSAADHAVNLSQLQAVEAQAGAGWNVSGSYHGYAYGPKRDGLGQLWVTLNVDMGDHADNKAPWRGWGGVLGQDGKFIPMAAGMRSPCGLGTNLAGDMFCVDQQGTWIPTTPIYHLRKGAFFLNPEGIASQARPDSPLKLSAPVPSKVRIVA